MKVRRLGITRIVSEEEYQNYWKSRGYEIVEEKEESLEDKTVDELREIAKESDMTGYYNLKKDELIEEIEKVK